MKQPRRFTLADAQIAHSLGVHVEAGESAAPDATLLQMGDIGEFAAEVQRVFTQSDEQFDRLAQAYQRIESECAVLHQINRSCGEQIADLTRQRDLAEVRADRFRRQRNVSGVVVIALSFFGWVMAIWGVR